MLKKFDFIKNKKISLIILLITVLIGVGSIIFKGFIIDIDFSGGSELQLNVSEQVTDDICNKINDIIATELGKEYVSSTIASTADNNIAIIRTGTAELSIEQRQKLITALSNAFPNADMKDNQFNVISATIGKGLQKAAILSVIISIILILFYIWIRFELFSGLAAILCLFNDVFVMIAFYSLFDIRINSNIIATMLTIIGYSLNATIIVFDRVRENRKKFGDSVPFAETVNLSIHQTLARSINTTLCTFVTVVAVYILGVESIRNFALPLMVGIIAGLFSSIFLSGVLWVALEKSFKGRFNFRKTSKVKESKNSKIKAK